MFEKFLKHYHSKDYYIKRKAEYSFIIIMVMLVAILIIIATEILLKEDLVPSLIKASVSTATFLLALVVIYKGWYELGVNIMITLGFARLIMIAEFDTPFQFYAMACLVLIAVNVIHYKKYQAYITSLGVMALIIYQAYRIYGLTPEKPLESRAFIEATLSIYLFAAIIMLLSFIRQIINTQIKEHEQLMIHAELDPLTSIYNRRKITELFNLMKKPNDQLTVIIFDIDDFKVVNDTFGHTVGDEILKEVSKIICHAFPGIPFGRWGGEEFLMLVPEDHEHAESIRKLIMAHEFIEKIRITVSLGQTTVLANDNLITATKRADLALYQSKAKGKNRVTYMSS